MATYVNDAIWRRLSEYYNVTPREAQVGDLYKRWLDEKGLNWGNAGDYFISQFPGVLNRGDAEWLFWTGGFGDDLVLLLDPSMEPQTGTAPQWVLNRADTRVPSARVGSTGRAELRGVYHGLLLPGAVGNSASVPLAASTSVDACVRVQMFASSGLGEMISKWGASGSWGWTLRQNGANVDAIVSSNGSNLYASVSVAHGMSIGDSAWFRLSYDRLNGRLAVWRADDQDQVPDRWTLLGQSLVTPANIFANATDVTFGVTGANVNPFNGAIKRGVVRSDVDGAVVLDVDFTAATPFAASFTALTGQTVTVTAATGVDSNDPMFLQHTGTNYLYLPGAANNFASTPDAAALDITGDIDIRAYVALDDWTPALQVQLVSKHHEGVGGYALVIETNGRPEMRWTNSAGSNLSVQATAATGVVDGSAKWVRSTLDVDNGASGFTVSFFLSDDGVTWTPLGTVLTSAGVTNIGNSATPVRIGAYGDQTPSIRNAAGKFYRAQVRNGIDGTVVFDADFTSGITSGSQTSFTESSSNGAVVTINRSTSGKKSAAVVRPVWLFGTNSFMEVVDNALLDFGATDSFTVLALARQWNTPVADGAYVSKRATGGWELITNGTAVRPQMVISDGATAANPIGPAATAGALNLFASVVDRTKQQIQVFTNTVAGTASSTSAIGGVGNATNLRVGASALGLTWRQDFELLAVAVIRRALTATELKAIIDKFTVTPTVQPFSPLDLSPALWLDASDATTITASSGAVSEWRDKSGNARHVSQGTAANQPTTGVDTLNGRNVLSFAFDSLVSASWTLAQPFTTIFVFRTSSASQQAFAILMDGARLGSGARAIVFANASNIGNVSSMDAGTRVDTGALTTSTSYAWASTFNGASSSSRRGGVATTINPGTSGIASGVQISSAVVSTVSFTGTIAEVIVVGSTLTAQQMTDLATYISEKWGVTL